MILDQKGIWIKTVSQRAHNHNFNRDFEAPVVLYFSKLSSMLASTTPKAVGLGSLQYDLRSVIRVGFHPPYAIIARTLNVKYAGKFSLYYGPSFPRAPTRIGNCDVLPAHHASILCNEKSSSNGVVRQMLLIPYP